MNLSFIDPGFNWKKSNLRMKNERNRQFFENHIVELHYSFQFKIQETGSPTLNLTKDSLSVNRQHNTIKPRMIATLSLITKQGPTFEPGVTGETKKG